MIVLSDLSKSYFSKELTTYFRRVGLSYTPVTSQLCVAQKGPFLWRDANLTSS